MISSLEVLGDVKKTLFRGKTESGFIFLTSFQPIPLEYGIRSAGYEVLQ
jgi:hypothetical protein